MEVCAVTKLSAINHSMWLDDVKALLLNCNCWNIVTVAELPPDEKATPKEVREYHLFIYKTSVIGLYYRM